MMNPYPTYGPAVEDIPPHAAAGVVAAVVGHRVEALEANTLVRPLTVEEGRPVIMMVMHMLDMTMLTLNPPLVEQRVFRRIMQEVEMMKNHRLVLLHNQYLVPRGVLLGLVEARLEAQPDVEPEVAPEVAPE